MFKGSDCLTSSYVAGGREQERGILALCVSGSMYTFLCTSYSLQNVCVCVCVCIAGFECDVAELWSFWSFHNSSILLCDRDGEVQSQTALHFDFRVENIYSN